MRKTLLPALLLPLLASPAMARESYPVMHAENSPTIDGKLNDPIWQHAPKLPFTTLFNVGDTQNYVRYVQLAWDKNGLYWAAEIEDHDITPFGVRHNDTLWHGDVVELFLRPYNDLRYYELEVNPNGQLFELAFPTNKEEHGMVAKATRMDGKTPGWRIEARIPWDELAGSPTPDSKWTFTAAFFDHGADRKPVMGATAPLTQGNFHRTQEYMPLRFQP